MGNEREGKEKDVLGKGTRGKGKGREGEGQELEGKGTGLEGTRGRTEKDVEREERRERDALVKVLVETPPGLD